MKIAIIHQERLAREALRRTLAKSSFETTLVSADPEASLERGSARLLLIELDLLGPRAEKLDRLTAAGLGVVVLARPGAVGAAYDALGRGALALLEPPALADDGSLVGATRFVERLTRIASLVEAPTPSSPAPEAAGHAPVLALGASTGGPLALATVLKALPSRFPAAVLIVQHIEGEFSEGLAQWLSGRTELPVQLAVRGGVPRAGQVYIAPPNAHLVLLPSQQFSLRAPIGGELHVPSVDTLFTSLAEHCAPGAAALLTGMGSDGAAGLARLRQRGWYTVAQDAASSVVYGMPRAAVELGAAEASLALPAIAPALLRHFAWKARG
jgi:two-component system response regulator WspF